MATIRLDIDASGIDEGESRARQALRRIREESAETTAALNALTQSLSRGGDSAAVTRYNRELATGLQQVRAEYERTRDSLDANAAAANRYSRAAFDIEAAIAAGIVSQRQGNQLLQQARREYEAAASSAGRFGDAQEGVAGAVAGTAQRISASLGGIDREFKSAQESARFFQTEIASIQNSFNQVAAAVDPAFAALLRYSQQVEAVEGAVTRGVVAQEAANRIIALSEQQYLSTINGLNAQAVAQDNATESLQDYINRITGVTRVQGQLNETNSQLERQAEQTTAAYVRLRESVDPLFRVQQQYAASVEVVNDALRRGIISQNEATATLDRLEKKYEDTAASARLLSSATNLSSRSFNAQSFALTQAGFQIQDFAVQVASGQSAMVAFTQQFPQLLSVFGSFGRLALIGSAIGTVVAVALAAAPPLIRLLSGVKDLEDAVTDLTNSTQDYVSAAGQANRPIDEQIQKYGELRDVIQRVTEARAQDRKLLAEQDLRSASESLRDELGDNLRIAPNPFEGITAGLDPIQQRSADNIRATNEAVAAQINTTVDNVKLIRSALEDVGAAAQEGPREIIESFGALDTLLIRIYGSMEAVPVPIQEITRQMREAVNAATDLFTTGEGTEDNFNRGAVAARRLADEAARAFDIIRNYDVTVQQDSVSTQLFQAELRALEQGGDEIDAEVARLRRSLEIDLGLDLDISGAERTQLEQIIEALVKSREEALRAEDAVRNFGETGDAFSRLSEAAKTLGSDTQNLAATFGPLAAQIQESLRLDELFDLSQLQQDIQSFSSDFEIRGLDEAIVALGLTDEETNKLRNSIRSLNEARGFTEINEAAAQLQGVLRSLVTGVETVPTAFRQASQEITVLNRATAVAGEQLRDLGLISRTATEELVSNFGSAALQIFNQFRDSFELISNSSLNLSVNTNLEEQLRAQLAVIRSGGTEIEAELAALRVKFEQELQIDQAPDGQRAFLQGVLNSALESARAVLTLRGELAEATRDEDPFRRLAEGVGEFDESLGALNTSFGPIIDSIRDSFKLDNLIDLQTLQRDLGSVSVQVSGEGLTALQQGIDLSARSLEDLRRGFEELGSARGPAEIRAAAEAIQAQFLSIINTTGQLPPELENVARIVAQVVRSASDLEDRMDQAASATGVAAAAASALSGNLSSAAGQAARVVANLNRAPGVIQGLATETAAIQAAIDSLNSGGDEIDSNVAAQRVRLQEQYGLDLVRGDPIAQSQVEQVIERELTAFEARERAIERQRELVDQLFGDQGGGAGGGADEIERLRDAYESIIGSLDPAVAAAIEFRNNQEILNEALAKGAINAKEYQEAMQDLEIANSVVGRETKLLAQAQADLEAGIVRSIVRFESFRDVAYQVATALAEAYLQYALFGSGPLAGPGGRDSGGFLSGIFDGFFDLFSAKGNAFSDGKVIPFQSGGILYDRTSFPLQSGQIGLAGEQDPEGILPLKRGSDGKLGVINQGNSGSGVTVLVVLEGMEEKIYNTMEAPRGEQIIVERVQVNA